MMRQYELVERVRAYHPDVDEDRLNRAYVYTVQMHGAQKRASGDPYFSHPVEVAGLMTDLKMDEDTIITALLHDTVEDTLTSIEDVEARFGPEVARLVDGVTKLSKIEAQTEDERAAENLRKFSAARSSSVCASIFDSLVTPSTSRATSGPKRASTSSIEVSVSSTVSWSNAVMIVSSSIFRSVISPATSTGWLKYGSPEARFWAPCIWTV